MLRYPSSGICARPVYVPDDIVRPYGDAMLQMGYNQLAADLFKTKPEDSPQRKVDMLVVRGKAFLGLGQVSRAKSSFRSARRIDPNSVDALIGLAHAVLQEGNVEHAAQFLARVKSVAPDDLNVLLLEGRIAMA